MCTANAMELSLKSDTFNALKEDFDSILARTIGNMEMKGAEDATITLKLGVTLEKTYAMVSGESKDVTKPSFKHDISSVMQVKDKKSGALTGDYQLVWDDEDGRYVMKRIEDGQITMFDDEGNVIEGEYREVAALPAVDETASDESTPFSWLKKFVGSEMIISEAMGNYSVRTKNNNIVLTSATSPNNLFYCSAETLEPHVGHSILCVGHGSDSDLDSISIECELCNEILYSLENLEKQKPYEVYGDTEGNVVDERESNVSVEEDYEYSEPDEEIDCKE